MVAGKEVGDLEEGSIVAVGAKRGPSSGRLMACTAPDIRDLITLLPLFSDVAGWVRFSRSSSRRWSSSAAAPVRLTCGRKLASASRAAFAGDPSGLGSRVSGESVVVDSKSRGLLLFGSARFAVWG